MATNPSPITSTLVNELYALDEQIASMKACYDALQKQLMALGDGTYVEVNGTRKAVVATPSAPKASYTLYPPALQKAFLAAKNVKKATPALLKEFTALQEQTARELAGEHFAVLFDRQVLFSPAKGYEDLIPRLFKTATATAKKLLLLCQVTKPAGSQYVKLTDKPKKDAAAEEEE
jgi:hypothetical protein